MKFHNRVNLALILAATFTALALGKTPPPEERADDPSIPAAATDSPQEEPETAAKERVVLRVNRNVEVQGHVELEDDDVIVVRTLRGKLESFSKSRVHQIVRLVSPEPQQRGVVYLRNGQMREGIIIADEFDHVTMEIEGVRARLRRETVSHVVLKPTFDQQYRQFKNALRPGMSEQHLMLCRWLIDNRRYALAQVEIQELLQQSDQDIPEARQLLRFVEAQLALQRSPANAIPNELEEEETQIEKEDEARYGRILTHEEVNLMRVYEIDFSRPPRIAIGHETIRKMIETHSANPAIPASRDARNALFRADPLEILRLMFKLRARELYGEAQVITEPHSLNLFRRVHDGWITRNCATGACHGGDDAGRLYLHRSRNPSDRVRYTNLLILERLEIDPEHQLIDYQDPEQSLLVQYGLPRDVARVPHPEVRGWRPAFSRGNDRMKQETIRWIKSMMQPRPDYSIDYEPPTLGSDGEKEDAEPDRLPR